MGKQNKLRKELTYGMNDNKQLWLLRGVAGSGKTSFLKKYNLEEYAISADTFRNMITNPKMHESNTRLVDNEVSMEAFKLLFQILEKRLENGTFTIIDNMHLNISYIKDYDNLAKKYGYNIVIINFECELENLISINKSRENTLKWIPDNSIIARMYDTKIQNDKIIQRKYYNVESTNDSKIQELLEGHFENLDYYDEIKIIGDVHGCYTVLKEALGEFNSKTKYIFLGDLIDRGIENHETLTYLLENYVNKRNVVFIEGNHDIYLNAYINNIDLGYGREFNNFTKNQIESISKKELKKLVKQFKTHYMFKFNDKKYLCTHGGLLYTKKLKLYSHNEFIYGVGDYSFNVDRVWNNKILELEDSDRITQFHGHRNSLKVGLNDYEYSYNLEDNVERGGNLRVVTITKDSLNHQAYKNTVYNTDRFNNNSNKVESFLTQCKNNEELIKIKPQELSQNIVSINFSRKVFYEGLWNDLTSQARGIFINTDTHKVVARAYNKFFNIGEYGTLDDLIDKSEFPIRAYKKENGFLGIVSYDKSLDSFIFATKGNMITDNEGTDLSFVNEIKSIFNNTFNDKDKEFLKEYILFNNVSLTFEVISLKDKHMVKYNKDELILLDIIKNDLEFIKFDYVKVQKLAENLNIKCKELAYTFKDKEKLKDIMKYAIENKRVAHEGFVFEDKNYNTMFKYKSWHYAIWKSLRSVFNSSHKYDEKTFNIKLINKFNKLNEIYKDIPKAIEYLDIIKDFDFYSIMNDEFKYITLTDSYEYDIPLIIKHVETEIF